ncbi:MAG: HAD family phosphatase [Balneolales bacterium]
MTVNFGVLFDMDGVIVHSNPTHKEALRIFFEKYDKDISESFLQNHVYGRTNKDWLPAVFGEIPPEVSNRLAREKEEIFRQIFDPAAHAVPGVTGYLRRLKQKEIKIVVATSAPVENANFILSGLSIEDCFDAVLDSSWVDKGKPEPEIYYKASRAIGYPPEQCVVFEDSISGVQAGLRAGSKVIGLTTTHSAEELKNCHMVIDDFRELTPEALSSLFH